MRFSVKVATLLLFLIPVLTVIYKANVLNLSLLPKEISDEWNLQVKIDSSYFSNVSKVTLPLPQDSSTQEINNLSFNIPDALTGLELHESDLRFFSIEGDFSNIKSSIGYQFRARSKPSKSEFPKSASFQSIPKKLRKYIEIGNYYTKEDREALDELSSAIIDQSANKLSSIKKAFFYVSEEIRLSQKTQSITEALALGTGSTNTKSRIFNYLMRSLEVPSRIGVGIQLEKDPALRPAKNLYRVTFFNELYINGSWYQIDLQKKVLGPLPESFIVLTSDIEFLELSLKKLQNLSIYAIPLRTNRYDSKIYSDELKRSDSLFYTFSLYSLPISAQMSMYIILLLPLGAVMISFFRNIVGFSTFGIFTPALLTIFFIETNFVFAIIFFALVVFLGFFQRILLDKLYLLAVPRISILLTFVIIAYMLFILINQNVIEISGAGSGILSYFPVVIITILIERFSIDFIEEGAWNTFKKLAGTITISIVCYFILTFKILQQFLFTNPEFLLWTIAMNLIIGNYKGYRLSEFFRFRELSKNINMPG
jgi:hypothetical protein